MLGILKYIGFFFLCGIGIGQSLLYRRISKNWDPMTITSGEITESKLLNQNEVNGTRTYHAIIRCKYNHLGLQYESEVLPLRSVQLVPSFQYEHELLQKYKKGQRVEIRLFPSQPDLPFLELQPLSKKSVILVPILLLAYAAFVFGYGWAMIEAFTYDSGIDPY